MDLLARITMEGLQLLAILFVFACQLGQTFWPNQVAAIAWLPWLLLCGDSLARRFQWRWWAW